MRAALLLLALAGCATAPPVEDRRLAACRAFSAASFEAELRWDGLDPDEQDRIVSLIERAAILCSPGYPATTGTAALIAACTAQLIKEAT